MAFKDILLTLTSYPDPTPATVAEDAVAIAATLGAHLAAVACEVHVEVPGHFLSGTNGQHSRDHRGRNREEPGTAPGPCWPHSTPRRRNPASCTKPDSKNARPSRSRICW